MSLVTMEYRGLLTIRSGGQDGIDRGALDAAKEFGVSTAGWVPRGWRTAHGPDNSLRDLYGLEEHWSPGYPPRTEMNVVDSDGTLIIASSIVSPGTALTIRFAKKHNRPCYICEIPKVDFVCTSELVEPIAKWVVDNQIETLNVAGNHKQPEYHHHAAYVVVVSLLEMLHA